MSFIEKYEKSGRDVSEIPSKIPLHNDEATKLRLESESAETPKLAFAGFPTFDRIIGGFRPEELIVLSGPTKHGKTTVAQWMTVHFSDKGLKSLWFSMEMSWKELNRKFCEMGGKEGMAIWYPKNNLTQDDLTLDWMREVIGYQQAQGNVDAVFIDHLHFLLPLKDYRTSVSFLIGGIVREMKKIARDFALPVFLIAHTTKLESGQTPDIHSLRDSSFVAQESDYVLMVHRPSMITERRPARTSNDLMPVETNPKESVLSVLANRRTGNLGKVRLLWDGKGFKEIL